MIGWELDKMSDEELAEKYEALCRAQIYSDEFPELVTNLKIARNYLLYRQSLRKLPTIMSAGMKL